MTPEEALRRIREAEEISGAKKGETGPEFTELKTLNRLPSAAIFPRWPS